MRTVKETLALIYSFGHFAYASRPEVRSSSWLYPAIQYAERAGTITEEEGARAELTLGYIFDNNEAYCKAHETWKELYALLQDFPDITAQDCPYVQTVFNKALPYYNGVFGMCSALRKAKHFGAITHIERLIAAKAILAYIRPHRHIYLAAALREHNLPSDEEALIAIYTNWSSRPSLERKPS